MKIPKKRNKVKGPAIICNYIWHTDTLNMCIDWRSYVLPNTNAVDICDIFSDIGQFFRPDILTKKRISKIKKVGHIRNFFDKLLYF